MKPPPRSADAPTIFDGPSGEPLSALPERIGAYRVEGRLGCGGMGEVFLAWDERLKRRVAIKRIRREAGLSPDQRERFRREASLAAKLSHPNIVRIYHVIEGTDDIVMEYVEGRTLTDRLAGGRLEIPEILRLACDIAKGLGAAHEAGLVHRDLKASNVMVTDAGHVKILDFGLARPVVRTSEDPGITQQGITLGTCHAMSPEQARGEEVDERSDLFSFGSLVHEMLTGRPPFRGGDPFDSMRKVLAEEPVHPQVARPDLPDEAAHLLLRLLKKDRNERPANAGEVVEVLKRLRNAPSGPHVQVPERNVGDLASGDTTPLALPASVPQDAGQPHTWTRRRVVLAGAVAVLLLVGAVAFYLKVRSTRPMVVAVINPEFPSEDKDLSLAAIRVHRAALDALLEMQGIKPVNPADSIPNLQGAPVDIGKTVGAKQILSIRLVRENGTALVTFQRSEVSGKGLLGTGERKVPLGAEPRRILTAAVRDEVQKIFSDYERRSGTSNPTPRDEDYDAFLVIQGKINAGEARREDLEQLEKIIGTSPHFPDARILAARIAYSLFLSRRDPADLERASELARQAQKMNPEDPRPLRQEFHIALTSKQFKKAETILERLEQLDPGDPDILPLRADLNEIQGNLDQAADFLSEAVEQAPSWQNRYLLADFEARHGRIEEARARIEAILLESPENIWAREAQGNIELMYGDPAQAEKIYGDLVDEVPPERALNNLGTAHLLQGRNEDAATTYRQALNAQPDRVTTLINLAEVEWDLGHKHEAKTLYKRACDLLAQSETDMSLPPAEAMLEAHCLARLGQTQEAVKIAREQLDKNPEDASLQFQSVLIFSLAGDRPSARKSAKEALDGGFQRRWFKGSAFQWLYEDPEVGPLLREDR